ncbi:hypothetical protein HHI36_006820 [Cryptolaemus montrouzieri]|uniref:Uncharacterized protein n=1 Tax=Cryptolaemus montrouzieri TaxID=559131 RepID=A0ABD2MNL7_9CUCU
MFSKSPRRNTSESIKISMSPTLSRNRKFNAKRVKHLKSQSSSSIIPLGKDVSNTLFAHKNHNTKLNSLVEDEDIFESSIIDTTPNVRTIKKSRNRVTSPRKTLKNLSGNTTLTQKFREMATRVKETKEGETLMETDITEDNFSKPNSLKSSFTSHSSRDDLKICTFARDYDK